MAYTSRYAQHGECKSPSCWSGGGGELRGQSEGQISWFKRYIENTTLHPPFEQCEGDDDGYVHTLTCGKDFILFHFYNSHPCVQLHPCDPRYRSFARWAVATAQ